MLNHSHSHSHSRHGSLSPLLRVLSRAAECSPPLPDYSEPGACRVAMDLPSSTSPSSGQQPTTPRRQLQGPRPPRLNVRMESHAIKKPSLGGAAAAAQAQAHVHQLPGQGQAGREQQAGQQPQPPRAPVIIYDASPKIIYAKPNEFMALVQRLTGPGSGPPPQQQHQGEAQAPDYPMDEAMPGQPFFPPELLLSPSAAMSPAARLATIERSVRPMPEPTPEYVDITNGGGVDDGGLSAILGSIRPGILSPLPSSLPLAAVPGQFSPLPFDASCISWLNELSPILRAASAGAASSGSGGSSGNTSNGGASRPPPSYYADPFVPSPRHLLATPTVPSPATCAELFSNLPDL
ncbi:hypothetical protein E2562_031053 [Oryza meyeriana var. granulata]|uniref:VQ domain-containing protein n=1 Tax=Oryza meyeriana var. granulata TaxID=110450 RepID=A0A6G1FE14_9ORYZ|nr:hypothetical protein E2562_031053 [Oryza meyeriana var. granulata]